MNIILIDTENIEEKAYEEFNKVENVKVVFFGTEETKKRRLNLHLAISLLKLKSRIKFEFIQTKTLGKNGLDFQICSYAGKLTAYNKNNIYILSHDKGYDNIVSNKIKRINSLLDLNKNLDTNTISLRKNENPKRKVLIKNEFDSKAEITKEINAFCPQYNKDELFINNLLNSFQNKDLKGLNHLIQKKMKDKNIENQKNLYKNLKKSMLMNIVQKSKF